MKQIIIVTKHDFVAKNIEDFLQNYFKLQFIWLPNFQAVDTKALSSEDVIIVINDEDNLNNDNLELVEAKVIVLTALKYKSNFNEEKIKVLTFPIFLEDLLQVIQGSTASKISSNKTLSIKNFKLILDYGEAILENEELKQQIHITATEGEILQRLFINYPSFTSKKDLLMANWQNNDNCPLEIHISNIKKKLLEKQFNLNITKNAEGYKLEIINAI